MERSALGIVAIAFSGLLAVWVIHGTAHQKEDQKPRGWRLLALGTAVNTAGILAVYLLPLQWMAAASALRMTATLLLMAGVFGLPRNLRHRTGRLRLLWDILLVSAAWLTLLWAVLLQPNLQTPLQFVDLFNYLPAFSDILLIILLLCLFQISEVDARFCALHRSVTGSRCLVIQ